MTYFTAISSLPEMLRKCDCAAIMLVIMHIYTVHLYVAVLVASLKYHIISIALTILFVQL